MMLARSFVRSVLLAAPIVLVSVIPPAQCADRDSPLVKPPAGTRTIESSVRPLDEYWLALGRLTGDGQAEKVEVLEGKWSHFTYANPSARSILEVSKHYEESLGKAGFEIVYSCKDADCGQGGRKTNGDWWDVSRMRRYLVARLARREGDVWVSVHVHARNARVPGQHEVDIVETKATEQSADDESGVPSAEVLARRLTEDGHVAVHTIAFEAGKPTLLPQSEPALKAIAELLATRPQLRLHVVVHTEGVGGYAANLALSRRRAAAVVAALGKKHRVPAGRLHAEGVGPLAPLASNATEEGRVKNRRVELVLGAAGPVASSGDR